MHKAVIVGYRCCWAAFLAQLVASFFLDFPYWWGFLPLGLAFVLVMTANRMAARPRGMPTEGGQPVEVEAPVVGRWIAHNSPASRVPSHGVFQYGQGYAIDVVAEPADRARPGVGWWPVFRRNRDFPGFGAPVLAAADATVVRAVHRNRDHLSRNSYPALVYLSIEGIVRDALGPGQVTGNHIVLDLGDGRYAMYAHLQRGSLAVRPGDRVRAGQPLARCGNSGNSTEPHVHFQLMDGPDLDTARGVPFSWRGLGVPANGEVFSIDEPALR